MEGERQRVCNNSDMQMTWRDYPPLICVTHAMPHLLCPENLLPFQEVSTWPCLIIALFPHMKKIHNSKLCLEVCCTLRENHVKEGALRKEIGKRQGFCLFVF